MSATFAASLACFLCFPIGAGISLIVCALLFRAERKGTTPDA